MTAPRVFSELPTRRIEGDVKEILEPQLRPAEVVVGHDLRNHKAESVEPGPAPDRGYALKGKEELRSVATLMTNAIHIAIGTILNDINPQDISRWFQSCAAQAMQS